MKLPFSFTALVGLFWAAAAVAAPLLIETSPIPLSEENPAIKIVGKLEYRGGLKLQSENKSFGGQSGLVISKDASVLRAVTDKGSWIRAKPTLDNKGPPVGLREEVRNPCFALRAVT
jgi:hypothetical protein